METPSKLAVGLDSSDALMAHGPTALHGFVADKLEAAMGKAMPQMEVRFKDLSISAKVFASRHSDPKSQLPTLYNSVKKAATRVNKDKYTAEKTILKSASGVFKPGTITLLLGQPGSGKSSLMKVLSGRFPLEKNVSIEGEITYNGVPQADIMKRLPQFAAYVTQRDKHFPTLTVKETLEFAHAFCGGGISKRGEELLSRGTPEATAEALDAIKALYAHYPEVIMKQLGLENCKDTIVGNAMLRGVSGGERKRVTTGEMEFGMKYMTLMDEISTGLDSAATFDIINTQRGIAKTLRKTVVIALLQPAPEVFELFDEVMIMNEGEVIYHGPRAQALGYFESLGFVCPPDRDVADFLLDLGTDEQYKYEGELPRGMAHFPRRASEFADIFRASSIHEDMTRALDAPHHPELLTDVGTHMDTMPEFRRSFWESTRILMKRQTMVTMRNRAFIRGRTIMVIAMGLIYSSTFWQVDPTDVQVAMGIMFQAILFLALGQVSQVPTFMASRDVFYKQRGANFFLTSAYVLACSVAQVPLALAESIIFGSMVYWMSMPVWRAIATRQLQGRLIAEAERRRLRELVAARGKLLHELGEKMRLHLQGSGIAMDGSEERSAPPLEPEDSLLFDRYLMEVETAFDEVDEVQRAWHVHEAPLSPFRNRLSGEEHDYFENMDVQLTPFDFKQTGDALWEAMRHVHYQNGHQRYRSVAGLGDVVAVKFQVRNKIQDESGLTIRIVMKRRIESGRTVILWRAHTQGYGELIPRATASSAAFMPTKLAGQLFTRRMQGPRAR